MSTSDIIQTLSKALTLLPEDSLLEVLVMTLKAASKHLAKNKTCPFQTHAALEIAAGIFTLEIPMLLHLPFPKDTMSLRLSHHTIQSQSVQQRLPNPTKVSLLPALQSLDHSIYIFH